MNGGEITHTTPQSLEAEEATLGAMLQSRVAIEIAQDLGLRREHFYRPAHRLVFDAIGTLLEKETVDELTVVNHMKARHVGSKMVKVYSEEHGKHVEEKIPVTALEEAGGPAYVTGLIERVPAVANARAYVQEVIDVAALRGLVEAGHEIARLGLEGGAEPDSLIEQAGAIVDTLTSTATYQGAAKIVTLSELLMPLYDTLSERHQRGGGIVGASTGYDVIDERWGGLHDGALIIIGARPAMGKSALLGELLEHVALDRGEDAYVVNLEMPAEQQAARTVSRRSDVDLRRLVLTAPNEHDFAPIHKAMERIHMQGGDRLHIDQARSLNITQIKRRAHNLNRRLHRRGRSLRLVGVDYLQLALDDSARSSERTADVSKISRGLKSLAMELDCPVIALAQLNREVERRNPPRPTLADLRDSGTLEQDADIVTFLYRPEYYYGADTPIEWVGKTEAITAKQRNGQPGTDVLGFIGRTTRFTDAKSAPEFVAGAHNGRVV